MSKSIYDNNTINVVVTTKYTSLQESTIISFSKSWSTVILKTVSTWLSVLVYLAMLVTPAWRKQSRGAGQTGSGQIPAGNNIICVHLNCILLG